MSTDKRNCRQIKTQENLASCKKDSRKQRVYRLNRVITVTLSRRRASARLEFLERRARAMRRKPTPPELAMQKLLSTLDEELGWNWQWQHVCEHEGFILDFYEPRARICLEVDGVQHARSWTQRDKDIMRDGTLEGNNIEVIRIATYRLRSDAMGVLEHIFRRYKERVKDGAQRKKSNTLTDEERARIKAHNANLPKPGRDANGWRSSANKLPLI